MSFSIFLEIGYCLSINLCPWNGKVLLYVRSFSVAADLLMKIEDVMDVDLSGVFLWMADLSYNIFSQWMSYGQN